MVAVFFYQNFFFSFLICLNRELLEESGLHVNELQQAGILKFEFVGEPEVMEVHVFSTNHFEGTPIESEGNLEV